MGGYVNWALLAFAIPAIAIVWGLAFEMRKPLPWEREVPPPPGADEASRPSDRSETSLETAARIAELEKLVARLRQRGSAVVNERDQWEKRAISAEARLRGASIDASDSRGKKYDEIKRLLAKELHPDSGVTPFEKGLKSEMFKLIWPKIEAIDRS